MRRVRGAFFACVFGLAASLLLARTHPFGDAGLHPAQPAPALLEHSSVPPDVRASLVAKCADCHSMQPRLPVYDRIAVRFAPVSWLIERDIVEGRKHMNLSLWDTWSADQQQAFAAKIAEETREGKMPLVQYRMIHRNARVSDADVTAFTRWAHGTLLPAGYVAAATTVAGDPARGKEVFDKRCTGCHAMDQNREGPRLRGVFGRTSGQAAGFSYSPALVKAHIVWNDESLEQWLAGPDTLVPGNNMDFYVPKAQERRDLISYLRQAAGR